MFFVAAGLYIVTNVIYVIFGTSEKAEWNNPPENDNIEESVPMIENTSEKRAEKVV